MEKLPKGWGEVTIGEIANVVTGNTPKKTNPENYNGKIPYYKPKDLDQGASIMKTETTISEIGLLESRELPPHSILVTCIGATIGKTGYIRQRGASNQQINSIIANENFNSKFLYYQVISSDFQNSIITNSSATTLPIINKSRFAQLKIVLPPLPEQQRIVAKLDTLFASLENIKIKHRALISLKERFISSCLLDGTKFYPKEKLVKFLEEGKERIGDEWHNCRKIGVSNTEGIIDLKTGQKQSFEKYKIVKPGDFIYNTMRVNIGSIAIYRGDKIAITSPDYVVFRVKGFISPELLLGYLKSDQGLLEIGANTKGSVRARLYFKSLCEVRIPIGPPEIQHIAQSFLKTFNTSLRKLDAITTSKIPRLEQSILSKAFKGELIEQLPTDGDAADLLKEIAEVKASLGKKKKR